VVVLEVKGYAGSGQAARDQVAGYARDLRAYDSAYADRFVVPRRGRISPSSTWRCNLLESAS